MEWLSGLNWAVIIPIAIVVLSNVAVGLSKYPKAAGVSKWLTILANVLSIVTHKDSPGTFKLPIFMSRKPAMPAETPVEPASPVMPANEESGNG